VPSPICDGRDERVRVAEQHLVGADDHVDGRQGRRSAEPGVSSPRAATLMGITRSAVRGGPLREGVVHTDDEGKGEYSVLSLVNL
jgi:hypothetical protein